MNEICKCGHHASDHDVLGCWGAGDGNCKGLCRCMEFEEQPKPVNDGQPTKWATVTLQVKLPATDDLESQDLIDMACIEISKGNYSVVAPIEVEELDE